MHKLILFTFVFVLLISLPVLCNESTDEDSSCDGDHCHVKDNPNQSEETSKASEEESEEDGPCLVEYEDMKTLFRWDPVEVGYEREIDLGGGQTTKMISRATKPPIFEITNFLTDEECDHIVGIAAETGMSKSFLHQDPKTMAHRNKIRSQFKRMEDTLKYYDFDKDGTITRYEVKNFAEKYKFVYMSEEELDRMISSLKLTQLDDGVITSDEMAGLPLLAMDDFYNDLKYNHPHHRDRFSEQTWLSQSYEYRNDRILKGIRHKVMKITNLSSKVVYGGEPLQVVHYGVKGHYHAHYDSQSSGWFPEYNCCHYDVSLTPKCRLCRYITILYYLNDVEEGGETAFPIAGHENFNESDYRQRKNGDKYNLSQYCSTASVIVKPKKGKAIMWYNHVLEDGWLGEKDDLSLHGGCDILKGEKWVANNWIPAPEKDHRHVISDYYNRNMPF